MYLWSMAVQSKLCILMNDHRSNAAPVAVTVLLLLLPCLYVGSYFALVQRDRLNSVAFVSDIGGSRFVITERYRVGGAAAKKFYAPLNWADRRIRRDKWHSALNDH
jgi:hypothetical protein